MSVINNTIWIDQYVLDNNNQAFIKEMEKKLKIKFLSFDNVKQGLNYIINELRFKSILVVVSGRFFPSYLEGLKANINNLACIPISIIFTYNKNEYKEN